MSSILRISGQSLDIDALLSENSLPFDRIWRKGEPRVLKGKLYSDSGANFLASGADLDEFDRQVSEATEYLEQHAPVIAKMVESNMGIALLPQIYCQQFDQEKFNTAVLENPGLNWTLSMAWNTTIAMSPATRAWLNIVKDHKQKIHF